MKYDYLCFMKGMYRIFLFVFGVLATLSCGLQESVTYMVRPHEELPPEVSSDRGFTSVFLAGTIDMGNSEDWQMSLYKEFVSMPGKYILFNPRQENWDASRPGEMEYQVRWELDHLETADVIIMYILGSSKSPISLLEMGLHARSRKMYVICEEDFYRFDNVCITCDYYGVPMYTSFDEFRINVLQSDKRLGS